MRASHRLVLRDRAQPIHVARSDGLADRPLLLHGEPHGESREEKRSKEEQPVF